MIAYKRVLNFTLVNAATVICITLYMIIFNCIVNYHLIKIGAVVLHECRCIASYRKNSMICYDINDTCESLAIAVHSKLTLSLSHLLIFPLFFVCL
jgi:hypothetical protein